VKSIDVGPLRVELKGELDGFSATLECQAASTGVWDLMLRLSNPSAKLPPAVELQWFQPQWDIHASWWPGKSRSNWLFPDWSGQSRPTAKATSDAPVITLHSLSGQNRLTFAVQDALHPVRLRCAVNEESGTCICGVQVIPTGHAPRTELLVAVRFDVRDIPYYQSLNEIADWWAAQPAYAPMPVPDVGRLPMYSTWYSFHQNLDPREVEAECRRAKELGCEAVIEDDGWQTLDSARGYAYTGDWQPDRIPDMAGHVRRVHEAGLKFILWYSVPFVGVKSKAFSRFTGKFLNYKAQEQWHVLDPRFPDVREYLITTYEKAMREWDLDGFKLDFVDTFHAGEQDRTEAIEGRDFGAVDEAVDKLFTDVMTRLRKIKPDVLIEFRQSYIGPLMRKYGNLFRAGDCPGDAIANRVRTLDIRLLCGSTAAHADMLMWHPQDSVESAALQLIHVLFSVPQISVRLDKVPPAHVAMLKFWLGFWREQRQVLLDGELEPLHPECNYPVVRATKDSTRIVATYTDGLAPLGQNVPANCFVINGTRSDRVIVEVAAELGNRMVQILDVCGREVKSTTMKLATGVYRLNIPAAGMAVIRSV
jgi:alpha-galactosidase